VALQSLKDLGRLTYRRFLELFRHMVGLLGRVISPSHGLYLHRTTQHRKTRTNIHAKSGIRTHDPSNQLAKTHASDRTASVTGPHFTLCVKHHECRSQWPCGLRRGCWLVGCRDRGFESRSRHGCLSASFCVVLSCVGRGLATG
jgi:hypothetical protein